LTKELLDKIDEQIKNAPKDSIQVKQEAGKVTAGFQRN
jgi:hypothetical protein